DVDMSEGKHGAASLKELQAEIGKLDTTVVRTRSGGKHFYFIYDGSDLRNTASMIKEDIDTRANGGYVVAPPSITHSQSYSWIKDLTHLKEAPASLLELLKRPASGKKNEGASAGLAKPVGEGRRNDELFKAAASMRARGMATDKIVAALKSLNAEICD